MSEAARKVGFWVVVGLVAVASERLFKIVAVSAVGANVPGLRKLAAA